MGCEERTAGHPQPEWAERGVCTLKAQLPKYWAGTAHLSGCLSCCDGLGQWKASPAGDLSVGLVTVAHRSECHKCWSTRLGEGVCGWAMWGRERGARHDSNYPPL